MRTSHLRGHTIRIKVAGYAFTFIITALIVLR